LMSDRENFLSRWSRRKREVLREAEAVVPPPKATGDRPEERDRASAEGSARGAPASAVLTFDPASLPSVQSITAETDIRGFLASGVPSELTRAALRRAFASDPAIRNFVGLADYDWDFNAADSIAGFGPLQMTDDVAKMAAQVLEPDRTEPRNPLDPARTIPKAEEAADKANTDTAHAAATEMHNHVTDREQPANEIGAPAHADGGQGRVAVQYTTTKPENRNVPVRRQHGGALPK
jgi:hypothetical protein